MNVLKRITLAACLAALAGAAMGDEGKPLFSRGALPEDFRLGTGAVSAMAVTPDLNLIKSAYVDQLVRIEVEPGVWYDATVTRVNKDMANQTVVIGRLEGVSEGTFLLARVDDAVALNVHVPTMEKLYRLQYVKDGLHAMTQLNQALLPDCEETAQNPLASIPQEPATEGDDDYAGPVEGDGGFGGRDAGGCFGATRPVLDTMIVYTDDARVAAGSTAAIRAECVLAIEATNECYVNSGISARARLVYCAEVSYNETGGSFNDHLDRLTDQSDGILDSIHTSRDSYNADIVAMFIADTESGGLGWCRVDNQDYSFSVTLWSIAAPSYVHAHETGHNLGCAHDRANADCGPSYTYGYGWRFFGNSGTQYRTVMSYAPGTRIPNFSNPNRTFDGVATGVAAGQANESYNALTINNRDTIIEGFQLTRYDIYVNFAYFGVQFGTASAPYSVFSSGVAAVGTGINAGEVPTLYVRTGTTTYTGTISKPMTIRACSGQVNIGGTP